MAAGWQSLWQMLEYNTVVRSVQWAEATLFQPFYVVEPTSVVVFMDV